MLRKLAGILAISLLIAFSWGFVIGCGEEDEEKEDNNQVGQEEEEKEDEKEEENNLVKQDLENYLDHFEELGQLEDTVIQSFEGVTGENFVDDETMYTELTETTLPEAEVLLSTLRGIEPETEEVAELHETFIEGWETQKKAFQTFVEGLEENDDSIIEEGNEILDEGYYIINQFSVEIEQLLEEHQVQID